MVPSRILWETCFIGGTVATQCAAMWFERLARVPPPLRTRRRARDPRCLIVVGPTPPPTHGVSVMTLELLEAVRADGRLTAHLDTRDPRPIATVGRLDLRNVWLALAHAVSF